MWKSYRTDTAIQALASAERLYYDESGLLAKKEQPMHVWFAVVLAVSVPPPQPVWHDPLIRAGIYGGGFSSPNPFAVHPDGEYPSDPFGIMAAGALNVRGREHHERLELWGERSLNGRMARGGLLMSAKIPFCGPLSLLLGGQGVRVRLAHHDTATPLAVGTEQRTDLITFSPGLALGRVDRMHLRAEALVGWFERSTLSVIGGEGFTESEPLSYDALPLRGGRIGAHRIPIGGRIRLDASIQYLEIMERSARINTPTPESPFREWRAEGAGTASLGRNLSLFGSFSTAFDVIGFSPRRMMRLGLSFGL